MSKEKRLILKVFTWFIRIETYMLYSKKTLSYSNFRHIRKIFERKIIEEEIANIYDIYTLKEHTENEVKEDYE